MRTEDRTKIPIHASPDRVRPCGLQDTGATPRIKNMKLSQNKPLAAILGLTLASASATMAATLTNTPLSLAEIDGDGDSFMAGGTVSGGTATIASEIGGEYPAVTSNFLGRMSQIGDSITVAFDIQLNTTAAANNRSDFRISLFDTAAGSELIGMTHFGVNNTRVDFMRFRLDQDLSAGQIGTGGGSHDNTTGNVLAPGGEPNNGALASTGLVHTFTTTVTRTGVNTLQYSRGWSNSFGSTSFTLGDYNDATGQIGATNYGDDGWGGGKMTQLNGVAIVLTAGDPWGAGATGSYTISNFSVTGTPVPEPSAALLGGFCLAAIVGRRRRSA